jgi:uncharacterized protein YuzE
MAMMISFDDEADMTYIYIDHRTRGVAGCVARTIEVTASVLADYGHDGQLIGIELFGSTAAQFTDDTYEALKSLLSERDYRWVSRGLRIRTGCLECRSGIGHPDVEQPGSPV